MDEQKLGLISSDSPRKHL